MKTEMRKELESTGANLYLIGFMGVGKSAVGRSAARMLRMRFLDSDHCIEEAQGRSISDIFAQDGEASFRRMERAFIESGHPSNGTVVACGGGLPIEPGMRELLLQRGVVICLFANPETILERTSGNARRPLLNVEDPKDRIRRLLDEREKVYMRTGIGISADGRSLQDVVSNVVRVYRREAKSWKAPVGMQTNGGRGK